MELYGNSSMFAELCDNMKRFYMERNTDLRASDASREKRPDWYKQNDMMGMMFYIDNFAGNMKGVQKKLDYIEQCGVNYIHLMPFLDTPEGAPMVAMQYQTSARYRKSLAQWRIWSI